ncbi:MAG: ribosome-associated translation inhibitor RaiA [Vampirovibrionales bacterium]|nr:ribosome-associated translation inhibitor RaiA [Vampirovibrionales bacterium]
MKLLANARNFDLTPAIERYVSEKFGRLAEHYQFLNEVHIFLEVEKNPRIPRSHRAEATVHLPGYFFRVEVASKDLYASIDALLDKVTRQLRKQKDTRFTRVEKGGQSVRFLHSDTETKDFDDALLMAEEAEEFMYDLENYAQSLNLKSA